MFLIEKKYSRRVKRLNIEFSGKYGITKKGITKFVQIANKSTLRCGAKILHEILNLWETN